MYGRTRKRPAGARTDGDAAVASRRVGWLVRSTIAGVGVSPQSLAAAGRIRSVGTRVLTCVALLASCVGSRLRGVFCEAEGVPLCLSSVGGYKSSVLVAEAVARSRRGRLRWLAACWLRARQLGGRRDREVDRKSAS